MTRTVLVTGASRGIGEVTARRFGSNGWTVYGTARDAGRVDAGDVALSVDVTDEKQVDEAVETVVEDEGGIDCVVNNAGNSLLGPVEETTVKDARAQFDVNVHGPHRVVRAVLPHMRDARRGSIINVSSVAGRVASSGMGTYAASKHALEALSDALRVEVAPFGVDVVLIEPGPVDTGFADDSVADADYDGSYAEVHDGIRSFVERGIHGPLAASPQDVAEKIVDTAEDDDPKPRYTVGRGSRLLAATEGVPSTVRDAFQDLFFRLP
ncbi:SDR family oxidoreductase [Haladaptatus sp. F3-133]|jgi:NAD(P)-dependent dehydrogenase (short-subunit alcohol dehydrogenase family)|uniref:SDR family oxidoreductase n=1 Tax=Halorutilus salinus TaxID=2487751 RepID=A0A9Q4C3T3_9EURY|nr:SDR family oxidoreductase [Halorutilus salinus]MCX2818455.1 SDR family oxidoreductase [Halorutilus salinus]